MFILLTGQIAFSKDELDNLLASLDKYTLTNNISISGESASYIVSSSTPVMNSRFKLVKFNGNVFYEDEYHTLIMKPLYDIWLDHKNKQIYISYKVPQKQKNNRYLNPSGIFELVKSQVKDCYVKFENDGSKRYTINYNPLVTDCIQSIAEIDKNDELKSILYFFTEKSYLSKTVIKYQSISTAIIDEKDFVNTNTYVIQNGNKWSASGTYKNYKIQIFDYEELF